jgi:CHAD domain-containing protein
VQLAALRTLKIGQEPRRKTQLVQGLLELRAQHEKKLRKALSENPTREIRKRLKRASKELKLEATCDPLAVARKMLEQVSRPVGPMTESVLHQYRIVIKRARYAAEFAPKSAEATRFIAELKRVQDAIGHWHDWLTLTHAAAARLGEVNQSSLVAALHNVTGGKFRLAVTALSASPTRTGLKPAPSSAEQPRKLGTKTPTVRELSHSAA